MWSKLPKYYNFIIDMHETIQKPNKAELQEEFRRAKAMRGIKKGLEKAGTDISLDTIRVVVEEYLRLMSNQGSANDDQKEIVIDRSMVNPEIPDDAA